MDAMSALHQSIPAGIVCDVSVRCQLLSHLPLSNACVSYAPSFAVLLHFAVFTLPRVQH
jgi:hypothetical protein